MVFLDTTMNKKYVVYEHITPDGMYYFGQTQNVERRWSNNGAEYKRTALQPYIEKYGWENIQHIVLFRDQTKEDALWIEDFLITTAREDGVCINKQRSGLVSKEEGYNQDRKQKYYEQNKDKIRKQRQQRYQKNREKELEQRRQRYQKNREKELEYYQKNREKRLEQSRQYYQKNRDEINERRRQRYQRKKEKKQFKEFGCLPLW